jgi:RNA polymerase sigma factor (sigma-70 family)
MTTTLTREILQMWRAPHRFRETGSYEDIGWQPRAIEGAGADEAALVARDRYHQACRAIAQLEGRQGEIMILTCIAGYEIAEVAEMLEISPKTVRVHLHHGRKQVQAIIGGEEGISHE